MVILILSQVSVPVKPLGGDNPQSVSILAQRFYGKGLDKVWQGVYNLGRDIKRKEGKDGEEE